MSVYKPNEIEPKWQKTWEENEQYKTDTNDNTKPKYYALEMFPYLTHTVTIREDSAL